MQLSESFNDRYMPGKEADNVLRVYHSSIYHYYDFTARILTTIYGSNSAAVTPFAQLDPEALVAMRNKLIELGGHPPELPSPQAPPPETPAAGQLKL
jgi:hypothetical protein